MKRQIVKQMIRSVVKSSMIRLNNSQQLESNDLEHLMFSTLELPVMNRPKLKLIPDPREYQEAFIDRYIAWILTNDPHHPFKSETMLKANYDIEIFSQRISELDLEYHHYRQKRCRRYRIDLKAIDTDELDLNLIGIPNHAAHELIEAARAEKRAEITTNYEEDLAALDREYAIIKQQCESRINPAREYLNQD
jgi:hypothetical protein